MSSFSWDGNVVNIYNGLNILTKTPISYSYFKEHFSHTIAFLNSATLTYNYDDNPKQGDLLYSHYYNFLGFYKEKLQLSDEQSVLERIGNSVKVSMAVVLMEHYKFKMSVNTDVLKPMDLYTFEGQQEYINQYNENQKTVYDTQLRYLTRSVMEKITFSDTELVKILKERMSTKSGSDQVVLITDAIRIIKQQPQRIHEYRDFLLGIDIDATTYSIQVQPSYVRAYILFNLVFLEQRYAFFGSGENLITDDELISDRTLIDKDTMLELYEHGNSGLIITCSLPFTTFNNFVTDKDGFNTLKKDIQKSYDDLYASTTSLQDKLQKIAQHMEKQIQKYGKVEFHVGTKNRDVSFVQDIVTQSDPKKYHETQEKLYGGTKADRDIHEVGGRKIFKKKRDISTL